MKKVKNILIKLKRKLFSAFSLKNIYVILLVAIWPAVLFYFGIFSEKNQDLAFLILGIASLLSALIILFLFKKGKAKLLELILFLVLGFLGLRLIEFFLLEEDIDWVLEEANYSYILITFIILFIYLSIKIYKSSYTGRIVVLAAIIFSLITSFSLGYVSEIAYEKYDYQKQADRLFDTIMLYEDSTPSDWKTYLDPDYDFLFSYPSNFSYDSIKENVSVRTKEIENYKDIDPLDEFWTTECIKKLNNQGRKILLCENDFNCGREEIYFIKEKNLIKVTIEQCPLSQAEFDALVNSFDIY